MNTERTIFVGSSGEATKLAAKIASAIAGAGMSPVVWNTGAFPVGQTLLERIENLPYEFDGAVLLATPDIHCTRQDESFLAPASNVIFEYGYLSSRLTHRRVAICRFREADLPSDLKGVKVIEGKDVDYEAPELPQDMNREITSWLDRLPRLAAGISPVTQSHGYSGRWSIENRYDLWCGIGSPRLSGLGSLLISAARRSKAGGPWPGSLPCRMVTVGDGQGTGRWLGRCGMRCSIRSTRSW